MRIKIANYKTRDVVHHSVPFIHGEVVGLQNGEITIQNKTKETSFTVWPVINGQFKILVALIPGENNIVLSQNFSCKEICLVYKPLCFKRFVRLVYIVCCDDHGLFQAPSGENNTASSASKRIALAAQMLQTFALEKLKSHGLTGKTFCLEEVNGQPVCHVFESSLHLNDALKMTENELWEHFAMELMKSSLRDGDNCKFLGVLSFTRYVNTASKEPKSFKEAKAMLQGYAALSAGGLALLGSACLHTWPQTLAEVPWRFGDSRRIDQLQLMDDSCNRRCYWACYSTTLGAMMHELGHIFDLGHTSEGIMSRGFDNIHRFFIVDLFYCSQPYQKKHNPYYQKLKHEQDHVIKLCRRSDVSWSSNLPLVSRNSKAAECPQKQLGQTLPKYQVFPAVAKEVVSKDKPPWRVPSPPLPQEKHTKTMSEAFWAKSSALILYFHKWFNDYGESEPVSRTGTKFASPNGIRIVEFRNREGTAFHHLEFMSENGADVVDIKHFGNSKLPENTNVIKIHVQDSLGNIFQHVFDKESLLLGCS